MIMRVVFERITIYIIFEAVYTPLLRAAIQYCPTWILLLSPSSILCFKSPTSIRSPFEVLCPALQIFQSLNRPGHGDVFTEC